MIRTTPDDGRFAHTRRRFEDALDVLGKHLQTLGRGDDVLLPTPDHEVTRVVERAQVAGVEPSAFKRGLRRIGRVQIAARDRRALHENLAVGRDSNVEPSSGRPTVPCFGLKG